VLDFLPLKKKQSLSQNDLNKDTQCRSGEWNRGQVHCFEETKQRNREETEKKQRRNREETTLLSLCSPN